MSKPWTYCWVQQLTVDSDMTPALPAYNDLVNSFSSGNARCILKLVRGGQYHATSLCMLSFLTANLVWIHNSLQWWPWTAGKNMTIGFKT